MAEEKKVVKTEEKVQNNDKVKNDQETRDMGDVVAKDSTAKDGVKQTP